MLFAGFILNDFLPDNYVIIKKNWYLSAESDSGINGNKNMIRLEGPTFVLFQQFHYQLTIAGPVPLPPEVIVRVRPVLRSREPRGVPRAQRVPATK